MTTRREFLATLGTGVGLLSVGALDIPQRARRSPALPKVGIQLYTVRSLLRRDFDGTLAKLAEIGYREVEFAAYFDRTPMQIRESLKANKLTSPSAHLAMPKDDSAWKHSLDSAREIGHKWAVIPWLDAGMRKTPDDWKRTAERFNQLAHLAHASGLRFAYHNHDFELVSFDGTNGLELLLSGTDPKAVEFEMDIYWVVKGGGDPIDLLTRYPNRFPLLHAKDATAAPERKMVDVGAGTIDFEKILKRAKAAHVFVEHDNPADPMQSAVVSYRHLSRL
jgi:sugar phosphate isomerase/epimerase